MVVLSPVLQEALDYSEDVQLNGLLFQHVVLCPTRVWLHYHRIDCAHLNRHMQYGLYLHQRAYQGNLDRVWGYGIHPDQVDPLAHVITEVKARRGFAEASRLQLAFYVAMMTKATNTEWTGKLRYPALRKTETMVLSESIQDHLVKAIVQITTIVNQPRPSRPQDKLVCQGCSYRMLCWKKSTEDPG